MPAVSRTAGIDGSTASSSHTFSAGSYRSSELRRPSLPRPPITAKCPTRLASVSFQAPRAAGALDGVRLGRQLDEDVRGEVRRVEDGEDRLGLLHEPCGVLLRHAQRGVARARLRLDDGAQLRA